MRKNTKGRRNQHIPAVQAREAIPAWTEKKRVENAANKQGFSTKTIKHPAIPAVVAKKGKCIKHDPQRPNVAMVIGKVSNDSKIPAFVNWKTCDGAIRRGWNK